MCGIAGIWLRQPTPDLPTMIQKMTECLRHRGPDGAGYCFVSSAAWRAAPRAAADESYDVALGHRRLAIIDLATGDQPMSNEDGSIHVVFNGEIYNAPLLRRELEAHGHRFATDHADTEVLVHGYEQWGAAMVTRLSGMFAFAILDARTRSLFMARDRFGKKPLYVARLPDGIAFASELSALRTLPTLDRELDPVALHQFLTVGYVPAPRTVFRQVLKLEPAQTATCTASSIQVSARYWTLDYRMQVIDEADALREAETLLAQAVHQRLVSDVPLGALLSGGVDSSVVTAFMVRAGAQPVKTFTAVLDDPAYSEAAYAKRVASVLNTDHHEVRITPDVATLLPLLATHFDEPFADASMIPTYLVAKFAREHVKVVLTGDGGDEIFGGYRHYAWLPRVFRLREVPGATTAARLLMKVAPGLLTYRSRDLAALLATPTDELYGEVMSLAPGTVRKRMIAPRLAAAAAHGDNALAAAYRELSDASTHPVLRMQRIDALLAYQPGDILTKVDRATMAVSLEARAPLLDHKLAEYMATVDPALKLKNGESKYLLKRIAERHVPADVLYRRKMGFSIPLRQWLGGALGGLVEDALLSDGAHCHSMVDRRALAQLVRDSRNGSSRARAPAAFLFACLCLELWLRNDAARGPAR